MTDQERELLIDHYRQILQTDPWREAKHFAQVRMGHLIAERSAAQVAKMERERGLQVS